MEKLIAELLKQEKEAHDLLSKNIELVLNRGDQAGLGECQDILLAMKDYMVGVNDLLSKLVPDTTVKEFCPKHGYQPFLEIGGNLFCPVCNKNEDKPTPITLRSIKF